MADNDDNQPWLDSLAGREAEGMSFAEAVEPAALRRVLLAREEAEQRKLAMQAASDEHALQAMLFRLRRERLIDRPFLRRFGVPLALAASVAMAALILTPMFSGETALYDEPPRMRGALPEDTVQSTNPKGDAEKLAAALKAARMEARIYQNKKVFVVDASLSAEEVKTVEPLFAVYGLKPREGQSRIFFRLR